MTIMVAEKMSEQMRNADSPIKGDPLNPIMLMVRERRVV